jgi:hypothetical protein
MERNQQRLVIGLAAALGLALLAIAFLLGRISAKPAVVVNPAPVVDSPRLDPPSNETPAPSDAGDEAALTAPAPAVEPSTAAAPFRESVPPPVPAPSLGHPALSADQQQIAAYFNQVDRIEDMGAGDPQAFAASMVQSMSSGDFSGFDDLLAKARAQRQRLQTIAPPRACVEHHRLALSLSADSVTMLERLKAALVKGDSTALMTIATEGKALETQTNRLKALADSIRRQAGL